MDPESEEYARDVASAMAKVFGSRLVGVYLHGSAVLGGFDARRSDIDILVVCEEPITAIERTAAAEQLSDGQLPCPARGIELSIVTLDACRNPTSRPDFELHMTTAPDDSKIVDGREFGGDPDLVLHFAVCQRGGRLLGSGQPAAAVFAAPEDNLIIEQMINELQWGVEHGPGEYAVLNSCRACRFATDGAMVSKVDGAKWALEVLPEEYHGLIQIALDRQRCLSTVETDREVGLRFIHYSLSRIAGALPEKKGKIEEIRR